MSMILVQLVASTTQNPNHLCIADTFVQKTEMAKTVVDRLRACSDGVSRAEALPQIIIVFAGTEDRGKIRDGVTASRFGTRRK